MSSIDIQGVGEVGKCCPLPNGIFVWIEPTKHPKKFFIRVSNDPKPKGRVRHRKHQIRLTNAPDSEQD